MAAIDTFHTLVSNTINLGTELDSMIPTVVKHAARFLERNFPSKYMELLISGKSISASATSVDISGDVTGAKIRSILQVSYDVTQDGETRIFNVTQIDKPDQTIRGTGKVTEFWLEGETILQLNAANTEAYTVDILLEQYSVWPPTASHWLLTNAEDVLLAKSVINLAPHIRDKDLLGFYKELYGEGLKSLFIADQALRQSARDERLIYDPPD